MRQKIRVSIRSLFACKSRNFNSDSSSKGINFPEKSNDSNKDTVRLPESLWDIQYVEAKMATTIGKTSTENGHTIYWDIHIDMPMGPKTPAVWSATPDSSEETKKAISELQKVGVTVTPDDRIELPVLEQFDNFNSVWADPDTAKDIEPTNGRTVISFAINRSGPGKFTLKEFAYGIANSFRGTLVKES